MHTSSALEVGAQETRQGVPVMVSTLRPYFESDAHKVSQGCFGSPALTLTHTAAWKLEGTIATKSPSPIVEAVRGVWRPLQGSGWVPANIDGEGTCGATPLAVTNT